MDSITYILSQVFIIISYLFLAFTYQIKNRKIILVYNFISLLATGMSYLFLSAYSGLAMTGVAIIRNIIFLIDEKKNGKSDKNSSKDYIILGVLYLISILFAILTYKGMLSMMSVVATMLYTFSVWQKNTRLYKLLGIPVETIGIIYNIYIFSVFGIILESILAISAVVGYLRESNEKKYVKNNC